MRDDELPRVLRLPFRSEHSRCCSRISAAAFPGGLPKSYALISTNAERRRRERDFHADRKYKRLPSRVALVTFLPPEPRMPRARWPANSHGGVSRQISSGGRSGASEGESRTKFNGCERQLSGEAA